MDFIKDKGNYESTAAQPSSLIGEEIKYQTSVALQRRFSVAEGNQDGQTRDSTHSKN